MEKRKKMTGKANVTRLAAIALAGLATTGLASCQGPSETIYNGFVADEQTLALAPAGSSREQVLLSQPEKGLYS